MTDEQILKALECFKSDECLGAECPYASIEGLCGKPMCEDVYDFIYRQKAEIERKTKLIAETVDEYANFKEAAKRREIARVRNIEQVADEEINRLKAEIERWKEQNVRLDKECDHFIRFASAAKSEAYKEFAERLHQNCEKYPYTLPSVLANIQITYEELTEGGNEPPKNDFKE